MFQNNYLAIFRRKMLIFFIWKLPEYSQVLPLLCLHQGPGTNAYSHDHVNSTADKKKNLK